MKKKKKNNEIAVCVDCKMLMPIKHLPEFVEDHKYCKEHIFIPKKDVPEIIEQKLGGEYERRRTNPSWTEEVDC